MKKQKKVYRKRILPMVMASAMLVSTFGSAGPVLPVQAQQAGGNAPFVNTWLVSGPFETAVADGIYDSVVPENPNLAQKAVPSVSSATLASNPPGFLIDGSERNQWVTEGTEVPCWAELTWEEPVTVGCMGITLWADGRHRNTHYDLIFTFEDGSKSDPVRVNTTVNDASAPTYYTPETPWENVKSVRVIVDPDLEPYPGITGIAEISVYQYPLEGTASAAVQTLEAPEEVTEEVTKEAAEEAAGEVSVEVVKYAENTEPEYVNMAGSAEVSASSVWQTGAYDYPGNSPEESKLPKYAVDGDRNTEWISQMHNYDGPPETWKVWDPKPTFIVCIMGLKPSPLGETFR